jgi:hypothetical protein
MPLDDPGFYPDSLRTGQTVGYWEVCEQDIPVPDIPDNSSDGMSPLNIQKDYIYINDDFTDLDSNPLPDNFASDTSHAGGQSRRPANAENTITSEGTQEQSVSIFLLCSSLPSEITCVRH